jgi:hypothetical protein
VTRCFVGGVTVQVRAHRPCFGGLVRGIGASKRLSGATRPPSESLWHSRSLPPGSFARLGGIGGVAPPAARSCLQSPAGHSPDTRRRTSARFAEVRRRVSGECQARLRCGPQDGLVDRGARSSAVYWRQAGFGWVARARERVQRPESGHRLAPEHSEKGPATIPSERAMNRLQSPKSSIESHLGLTESFRVREPISTSQLAAVSTPPPRINSLRYTWAPGPHISHPTPRALTRCTIAVSIGP